MRIVKSIESVLDFRVYKNVLLIVDKNSGKLTFYDLSNDFEFIKELDTRFASLNIWNDYLVDYGLRVYNLNKDEWCCNDTNKRTPVVLMKDRILFYELIDIADRCEKDAKYYQLDLCTKLIEEVSHVEGVIDCANDYYILTSKENSVHCYSNFVKQWEIDISEIGAYENIFDGKRKGYVKNVYVWQNCVVVLAGCGIVCVDIKTGKTIWEHRNTLLFSNMLIINGVGYLNVGCNIAKIDIATGVLHPYKRLDDIVIGNEKITPYGDRLVFFDGLLYYNVDDSGKTVLVTISPETLELRGWEYLQFAMDGIYPPVFYKNMIFVKDKANNFYTLSRE